MLKLKLFSLKDSKTGSFQPIHCFPHVEEALRTFAVVVCDPKTTIFQYSQDFDLYCVGEFDVFTGIVTPEVSFIANCKQILITELQRRRDQQNLLGDKNVSKQSLETNPDAEPSAETKKAENAEGRGKTVPFLKDDLGQIS